MRGPWPPRPRANTTMSPAFQGPWCREQEAALADHDHVFSLNKHHVPRTKKPQAHSKRCVSRVTARSQGDSQASWKSSPWLQDTKQTVTNRLHTSLPACWIPITPQTPHTDTLGSGSTSPGPDHGRSACFLHLGLGRIPASSTQLLERKAACPTRPGRAPWVPRYCREEAGPERRSWGGGSVAETRSTCFMKSVSGWWVYAATARS